MCILLKNELRLLEFLIYTGDLDAYLSIRRGTAFVASRIAFYHWDNFSYFAYVKTLFTVQCNSAQWGKDSTIVSHENKIEVLPAVVSGYNICRYAYTVLMFFIKKKKKTREISESKS